MIGYQLLEGDYPFKGDSDRLLHERSKEGIKIDSCYSKEHCKAMAFIQYLLNPDMNQRPTAEEALNHPWLSSVAHKNWDKDRADNVLKNMTKFRASSVIHKLLYNYIGVHRVPEAERRNIDAIWTALDDKKNGNLSKRNLKYFFNCQGKMVND